VGFVKPVVIRSEDVPVVGFITNTLGGEGDVATRTWAETVVVVRPKASSDALVREDMIWVEEGFRLWKG
jgi:hypothetical protein